MTVLTKPRVLTRFQRWLLGEDDPLAAAQRYDGSVLSPFETSDEEEERRRLEMRLCEILAAQPVVTTGRIFFLDLDELRSELSDQWPDLQETVSSVARTVFRRYLSPQDAYCRHGDDGFLVVFGARSVSQASVICQRIADELRTMLMGNRATGKVAVKSVVGHAESRLIMQELSLIDRATRVGARQQAVAGGTEPGSDDARGAAQAPSALPPRPRGGFDRFDPGWNPLHWHGVEPAAEPTAAAPANPPARRSELDMAADEPGWERLSVDSPAAAAPDEPPAAEADEAYEPPIYHYQPIWDVKNSLLSTYLCLTPDEVMSEPTCTAAGADLDIVDADAVAAFDLCRLLSAVDMLDQLIRNHFQLFINTAVHAETMGPSRHRRQYLHVLRRVPAPLRKFLIVQLYGLPTGAPTGRIVECVTALRPYCGAVLIETGLAAGDVDKYAGIGIHAVGADLRTVPTSSNRLISDLSRFAAEAHRHRLWTFLTGVTHSNQASVAITAGIRYLSGRRIGPAAEVPMQIRRFTLKDFYGDALAREGDLGLPHRIARRN